MHLFIHLRINFSDPRRIHPTFVAPTVRIVVLRFRFVAPSQQFKRTVKVYIQKTLFKKSIHHMLRQNSSAVYWYWLLIFTKNMVSCQKKAVFWFVLASCTFLSSIYDQATTETLNNCTIQTIYSNSLPQNILKVPSISNKAMTTPTVSLLLGQ